MSAPRKSGLEMSAKAPLLGAGAGAGAGAVAPEHSKDDDGGIGHKPKFSDEQAAADRDMVERTDKRTGLSSREVTERRAQFGPNELEQKKVNPLFMFLAYFWCVARISGQRAQRAQRADAGQQQPPQTLDQHAESRGAPTRC